MEELDLYGEDVVYYFHIQIQSVLLSSRRRRIGHILVLLTQPMSRQRRLLLKILRNDDYRERVSAIRRDICDFLGKKRRARYERSL